MLQWGHVTEGIGHMTHQGDRRAFETASQMAGARGERGAEEGRGEPGRAEGSGPPPRAELNDRMLRPCRPEGRLYE